MPLPLPDITRIPVHIASLGKDENSKLTIAVSTECVTLYPFNLNLCKSRIIVLDCWSHLCVFIVSIDIIRGYTQDCMDLQHTSYLHLMAGNGASLLNLPEMESSPACCFSE